MHGSKILAIEYYLPKKKENNNDLKKFNPKLDINRIKEKTGINNRFISGEKESIIDISIKCSNKIFKKFSKKKVDFLILVTQTSPYRIPTTACILQDKLGLKKELIELGKEETFNYHDESLGTRKEQVLKRIWTDAISGDMKKIQLLAWLGCLD